MRFWLVSRLLLGVSIIATVAGCAGMGAIPEFAPVGQDLILRSSSVVQSVKYGARSIAYRTFDAASTEVIRLSFKPAAVTAGGRLLAENDGAQAEGYSLRSLPGGDWVLEIRHTSSGEIGVKG